MTPLDPSVSCDSIKAECVKVFFEEKMKLLETLENVDRLNLTIDLWPSNQTLDRFISIKAHYIDGGWELHRKC